VLKAYVAGRKNVRAKPLADKSARGALARLAASPAADVRAAAAALEKTFVATVADDDADLPAGAAPRAITVSDETYQKFVTALSGTRNLERGHQFFRDACASCHRVGKEGFDVAPDIAGQIGMGEEYLLKMLLLPHEHMRPGYETTLVKTSDGGVVAGILKSESATSLTLAQPNGVEAVLLRKDVSGVRRLATSLMPSYGEALKPADAADLLAWLRDALATSATPQKAQKSKRAP
jgi:putative heme-binding domain-containing protein